MRKRYYVASGTQANYRGMLVNSRTGIHPDAETIARMNEALSPAVRNGQSVDAIIANNPELFARYARSTIYGWIEDRLFSSKKHNLPFAGTRRKPHKRPEIKTNAKCRVGRCYVYVSFDEKCEKRTPKYRCVLSACDAKSNSLCCVCALFARSL